MRQMASHKKGMVYNAALNCYNQVQFAGNNCAEYEPIFAM